MSLVINHFGDRCQPGIIIDDILNIREKKLFMLGIFNFNNIIDYLNNGNYEDIYNKENLIVNPADKIVYHKVYGFCYNHDYKVDANFNIINYDEVKERYDMKIANFKNMCESEAFALFINFTDRVENLKINEMIDCLNRKKKGKYHLMIFTYNSSKIQNESSEYVTIIYLKNRFSQWWKKTPNENTPLYEEIYSNMIKILEEKNIVHNFPIFFKDTFFGKQTKLT